MNRWTKTQKDNAYTQGWGIFAIDGNQNNLQIQRIDETEVFDSDEAALNFVIEQAKSGNTDCKYALEIVHVNY